MKYAVLFVFINLFFSLNANSQMSGVWTVSDTTYAEYGSYPRYPTIVASGKESIVVIAGSAIPRPHYLKRSKDGGKTWSKIFVPGSSYDLISVANPQKDVIVVTGDTIKYQGMDQNYNTFYKKWGFIAYSNDGGSTWNRIYLDSNSYVQALSMADANNGIAVKSVSDNMYYKNEFYYDTLLVTNDGWKTFKKVVLPDTIKYSIQTYCISAYEFVVKNSLLYKTSDSGKSWDKFELPEGIIRINFNSRTTAYGCGSLGSKPWPNYWIYSPLIFKSVDGYQTWTKIVPPWDSTNMNSLTLSDISFCDEMNGLVVGSSNSIYRTEDGGQTWVLDNVPYLQNMPMKYDKLILAKMVDKDLAITGGGFGAPLLIKYEGQKTLSAPIFKPGQRGYSPINNIPIEWGSVTGATKYHLQVTEERSNVYNPTAYDSILILDTVLTDTKVYMNNLKYGMYYPARIKAQNDSLESTWGVATWIISTFPDSTYVTAPTFIIPVVYSVVNPDKVKFTWTSSGEGLSYDLQVNSNDMFYGTLDFDIKDIKDTSYTLPTALNDKKAYYARVRVHPIPKNSNWSNVSFLTNSETDVSEFYDNKDLFCPAITDYLYLKNETLTQKIEIFSALGLKVLETEWQEKIDVSGLLPGVYFVRAGDRVSKFVKI